MAQVLPLDSCEVVAVDPDKVALARESIPGSAEAGELCVCDLAAVVEVPETTVSQALRLLRTAGVVDNRRSGRMIFYRLADAHVRMLLDLSREHTRHDRVR